MSSKRKRGFTLIELLMVIAVIAVLMSILIPALGKVRALARDVVCKSNLRQWGFIWNMYTQKNNNKFHTGYTGIFPNGDMDRCKSEWPYALRDYYGEPGKLTCCPMATNPSKKSNEPFGTWGPADGVNETGENWIYPNLVYYPNLKPNYGSYGANRYIWTLERGNYKQNLRYMYWKTTAQKRVNNIPVFFDCSWVSFWANGDSTTPVGSDPPEVEWELGDESSSTTCMKAACIPRHGWHINMLFMDWSVRSVLLKELWCLYWNKGWAESILSIKESGDWPPIADWPEWMRACPDPDCIAVH